MSHKPPVDQRIVDEFFRLQAGRNTKQVAWLFGMIATYGIKPEELKSFDWGPGFTLVLQTKKRPVAPVHPQWAFLFGLQEKRPCKMQDRLESLISTLYRLMEDQAISVNITDLLLAHRMRKALYKPIKQPQPPLLAYAGAS